ncbi:SCAN domain-containing protein 3 [Trichonephila clavipes]|nr:SCAN domain-containing protein 3 [Trichonephila clavipes]
MCSNIEKNQTLTEFVSEEQFNETIGMFLNKRQYKEKPLWTRERIEEAIADVEQFKLAPLLKRQRTHKQYYYGKKYDVMEEGTEKYLILKRKFDFDPVVKVVPAENFYHILRETHESTGHGGRDKMLYSLKSQYLIPTSVVLEFLKLCTVCQSKKTSSKKGIVVSRTVSRGSWANHRGQVDLVDLESTPDGSYKWLLHYQDHATKFSFLRPLTSKRTTEVALELLKIFLEVGCPSILQSDNDREFTAAVIQELKNLLPTCKILNGRPIYPAHQGSAERSNQVEAMLRAWLVDNNTQNWALGCYFVQFQKNSSFLRTIKQSPYKALFGTEPKTGLQSSCISKELLEKLDTEEDLGLLLNQQDHDNISTPKDLPVLSVKIEKHDSTSKDLLAPELIDYNSSTSKDLPSSPDLIYYNASTSKDLPSPELIDYSASTSEDLPSPELIDYSASTSYDQSMVKSMNNNTSESYDLRAADLLTKKALNLDLQKIESFSLSTTGQLETVNNSTSTPSSTVKASVMLLASEGKAAVSNSKACCVVCGMESTGAHSCGICKNPVHALCGNTLGEEYGSKIVCNLCRKEGIKYQRKNPAKHLKRSAEKMEEVSLKKFKDLSMNSTVLVNVPKVDGDPFDGTNIVGIVIDIKDNLYQIGTSVGIIKDWLPRNALQIANTTFTETVPGIILSLPEIVRKLSLFVKVKDLSSVL